jgi:hypothetical protein
MHGPAHLWLLRVQAILERPVTDCGTTRAMILHLFLVVTMFENLVVICRTGTLQL